MLSPQGCHDSSQESNTVIFRLLEDLWVPWGIEIEQRANPLFSTTEYFEMMILLIKKLWITESVDLHDMSFKYTP